MSRANQRFIWDERVMQWVPFNLYRPPNSAGKVYVISDSLEGVYNPATGKTYDSKTRYFADLQARGCHVVEPGESMDGAAQRRASEQALGTSRERALDIKKSIEQLKAGYRG